VTSVIHPCVHPEDGPAPDTEEKMFEAVVRYLDRLVAAARPRKLLYLAIDGVAPRAKMNQQRSRRFKAAKEMADAEEVEEEKRRELAARGVFLPPKKSSTFDYNVITPGTGTDVAQFPWPCATSFRNPLCVSLTARPDFMDRLAHYVRHYLFDRLTNNPAWKDLRVIFSDASVPGEVTGYCCCCRCQWMRLTWCCGPG
jgi:5'-3' exoribonuclease 2